MGEVDNNVERRRHVFIEDFNELVQRYGRYTA